VQGHLAHKKAVQGHLTHPCRGASLIRQRISTGVTPSPTRKLSLAHKKTPFTHTPCLGFTNPNYVTSTSLLLFGTHRIYPSSIE